LAFELIGIPPIAVSMSILRVYLYGFGEIRDGFVILAFELIGISPIAISPSIPWA
jgi:hypothetical protein